MEGNRHRHGLLSHSTLNSHLLDQMHYKSREKSIQSHDPSGLCLCSFASTDVENLDSHGQVEFNNPLLLPDVKETNYKYNVYSF